MGVVDNRPKTPGDRIDRPALPGVNVRVACRSFEEMHDITLLDLVPADVRRSWLVVALGGEVKGMGRCENDELEFGGWNRAASTLAPLSDNVAALCLRYTY